MTPDSSHREHSKIERIPEDRYVSRAADVLASSIHASIRANGRCVFAVSGGSTPGPVFAALAERALRWNLVTIVQVDERIAPAGSDVRNLTGQRAAFAGLGVQWLPLPIADDLETSVAGIAQFEAELRAATGDDAVIDLVHLGLGDDGHTASLIPGDRANDLTGASDPLVVPTADLYQGTHRLTFTPTLINRAAKVVWLVRGANKAERIDQVLAADPAIPAGRLTPQISVILADTPAGAQRPS